MDRAKSNAAKIDTPFGSFYVHVDHADGRVVGFAVHHPQKFEDTEIGKLLEVTFDALNREIAEICAAEIVA